MSALQCIRSPYFGACSRTGSRILLPIFGYKRPDELAALDEGNQSKLPKQIRAFCFSGLAQSRKVAKKTSDLAVVEDSTECYHRQMWHSIPLTAFWFVYFGSLGIFFPYFSLYLRENAGLSGTQVGLVLAISPLVGMIAQPVWGQIADRTGARARTLAFLTVGTAIGYLLLGRASGFWPIVAATAFLALVGTPIFVGAPLWGSVR